MDPKFNTSVSYHKDLYKIVQDSGLSIPRYEINDEVFVIFEDFMEELDKGIYLDYWYGGWPEEGLEIAKNWYTTEQPEGETF